ncbi:unnamed protein product [Anisakis simplex]|uniref:TAFII28 domain-containing protein n=1 Tax=Anisakis simplex TaxID=6269 RepID=A0A0M3J954_ANISI|nr:unnamed protein product [Anisakis simplex]
MAREREESAENSDEVYDEIDQFHRKRNEVLDLDEGKQSNKIEEVLNVEGDISSDEDEEFADGNSDADRDSLFDSSDNEQNKADTSKGEVSNDNIFNDRADSTSFIGSNDIVLIIPELASLVISKAGFNRIAKKYIHAQEIQTVQT